MAITSLPENPSKANASLGKEFLLYVDTSTEASPAEWTLVGGQRSTSLKRSADEIDASDKTTGGWKRTKAGLRSWSMEAENVVILDDKGAEALNFAYENGKEIHCKFAYPNDVFYTGWGSLTDFSMDTQHDDVATLSLTINGNGALKKGE